MGVPKQVQELAGEADVREIADHLGYYITSNGDVISTRRMGCTIRIDPDYAHFLKPKELEFRGYRYQEVMLSGRRKNYRIHSLVMNAFVGPAPDEMEIRHINNVSTDNRLANLRYGTHSENMQDKIIAGTDSRGEKSWHNKLTKKDVLDIKAAIENGSYGILSQLARKYGVHTSVISGIKRGTQWRWLNG